MTAILSKDLPVTVLSGFLGSGKTTLLKHILTSEDHKLKIAVIVNDMAEVNVDANAITSTIAGQVTETKKEVVKLQNGCICCTLRGDLIKAIDNLRKENKFDYVIIESTGIAEPQQVAESFCIDPELLELTEDPINMLNNTSRLDTCVSVVDVSNFNNHLKSLKRFNDIYEDGLESKEDPEGEKSISELLVEQVEFANVIILNKIDLVDKKVIQQTERVVKYLNPKAKIYSCSFGKVELKTILNTRLFNLTEASQTKEWLASVREQGVSAENGEADEYGVTSFVYEARKPFHPNRLYLLLRSLFYFAQDWKAGDRKSKAIDERYGTILRSKGFCWIAGRDSFQMSWGQSGQLLQLEPSKAWFCLLSEEEWSQSIPEELFDNMRALMISADGLPFQYGDRRQEIVIIGTDLNRTKLETALDDCLLTDEEVTKHNANLPVGIYPDPIGPFVVSCSEIETLYLISRPGQNFHFDIEPNFVLTLQNFCLNLTEAVRGLKRVNVWLDSSNESDNGVLVAILTPGGTVQQSVNIDIHNRVTEDEPVVQQLRVEPIGVSYSISSVVIGIEVHIMGKVESVLPN